MTAKKILVVDDSNEDRELMKVILESRGYVVTEASNGRQAIELINSDRPDLVFMDIRMPRVDGISASKLLKLDPLTRDIPLIIITSFAMHDEIEKIARDTGCADYLSKPIDIRKTIEMVEKHIGKAE